MHGVSHQEATTLASPLAAAIPALLLYLYLPQPDQGGNKSYKTDSPICSRAYLRNCMAPSVQWDTHLWACKTHEMREGGTTMGDGIDQNIHPGDWKIPHFYTWQLLGG